MATARFLNGVYVTIALCLVGGPAATIARADLKFVTTIRERGEVRAGVPLKESFAFTNDGAESIKILEVRSTCGCLAPRVDKQEIAPGERGEVLVEVNTLSQPAGHHNWATRVRYQVNGTARETVLELIAKLTTDVTVEPAALVLHVNQPFTQNVLLSDRRPKTFQITRALSSTEHLTVRVGAVGRSKDGRWCRDLQIDLAGDHPDGRFEQIVSLYTDDPEYPEIRLPVTVVKRSHYRLSATPAQAVMELRGGQQTASRLVLIRDEQQQPIVINRAVADHPALSCRWSEEPGSTGSVRITLDRTKLTEQTLDANVRIYVTKPDPYLLTIPVRAQVEQ